LPALSTPSGGDVACFDPLRHARGRNRGLDGPRAESVTFGAKRVGTGRSTGRTQAPSWVTRAPGEYRKEYEPPKLLIQRRKGDFDVRRDEIQGADLRCHSTEEDPEGSDGAAEGGSQPKDDLKDEEGERKLSRPRKGGRVLGVLRVPFFPEEGERSRRLRRWPGTFP
jgi:hypothetical protein